MPSPSLGSSAMHRHPLAPSIALSLPLVPSYPLQCPPSHPLQRPLAPSGAFSPLQPSRSLQRHLLPLPSQTSCTLCNTLLLSPSLKSHFLLLNLFPEHFPISRFHLSLHVASRLQSCTMPNMILSFSSSGLTIARVATTQGSQCEFMDPTKRVLYNI